MFFSQLKNIKFVALHNLQLPLGNCILQRNKSEISTSKRQTALLSYYSDAS